MNMPVASSLLNMLESIDFWLVVRSTTIWWSPIVACFIGAFGVHLLTRSRENEAWIRNCEKEEWRELITAMTKAEVLLVGVANAAGSNALNNEKLDEYNEAAKDAFRTILDRIFIADVLARSELTAKWSDVQSQFIKDQNVLAASAEYATIKQAIIRLATKQQPELRNVHLESMSSKQNDLVASTIPCASRLLRAFAWGVGCGVGLSVILLSVHYYTHHPKQWNTHALTVKGAKAESIVEDNDKWEPTSTGITVSADIENTTAADVTLPLTLTVMETSKATGALHGSLLKLDRHYFLPAHHIATITLDNSDLCAAKDDPRSCFDHYFDDEKQIVVFDDSDKYEIDIPVPAFTSPKSESTLPNH